MVSYGNVIHGLSDISPSLDCRYDSFVSGSLDRCPMPDHMQGGIRRNVYTSLCNKVQFHVVLARLMGSYDSSYIIYVLCETWCSQISILSNLLLSCMTVNLVEGSRTLLVRFHTDAGTHANECSLTKF